MFSDKELTEGIASNNHKAIQHIYNEVFPFVESYLLLNNGTTELAKDIFQEAMIVLLNKIKAGEFSLDCKLSTYLTAVCKMMWMQEKRKYAIRMSKLRDIHIAAEPQVSYGEEELSQVKQLFDLHFNKLDDTCKKILTLHFNEYKIEEIKEIMNISSIHNTSDKKFRCKKKLTDRIKADPASKKYMQ